MVAPGEAHGGRQRSKVYGRVHHSRRFDICSGFRRRLSYAVGVSGIALQFIAEPLAKYSTSFQSTSLSANTLPIVSSKLVPLSHFPIPPKMSCPSPLVSIVLNLSPLPSPFSALTYAASLLSVSSFKSASLKMSAPSPGS